MVPFFSLTIPTAGLSLTKRSMEPAPFSATSTVVLAVGKVSVVKPMTELPSNGCALFTVTVLLFEM